MCMRGPTSVGSLLTFYDSTKKKRIRGLTCQRLASFGPWSTRSSKTADGLANRSPRFREPLSAWPEQSQIQYNWGEALPPSL